MKAWCGDLPPSWWLCGLAACGGEGNGGVDRSIDDDGTFISGEFGVGGEGGMVLCLSWWWWWWRKCRRITFHSHCNVAGLHTSYYLLHTDNCSFIHTGRLFVPAGRVRLLERTRVEGCKPLHVELFTFQPWIPFMGPTWYGKGTRHNQMDQ